MTDDVQDVWLAASKQVALEDLKEAVVLVHDAREEFGPWDDGYNELIQAHQHLGAAIQQFENEDWATSTAAHRPRRPPSSSPPSVPSSSTAGFVPIDALLGLGLALTIFLFLLGSAWRSSWIIGAAVSIAALTFVIQRRYG